MEIKKVETFAIFDLDKRPLRDNLITITCVMKVKKKKNSGYMQQTSDYSVFIVMLFK